MNQLFDFFSKLFDSSDWPPRWHCGKWTEFHGWLYIISDLLIWSAYFTIPIVILRFISKKQDGRFSKLYFLFAAFILACGATHFLDAVAFWVPLYRLNGLFRLVTGIISWATVFYLVKNLPLIFSLRSQKDMEFEIAQRKKAEEKFKGLLEAAPDAMIIANEQGQITLINLQTEKLFGYTKEELIGKPVEILIPADLHHKHIGERIQYFKDPKVRSMGVGLELFAVKKSGEQFPVEISLSPLITEDGTLISASVRDISERKKAEAKLKKAKNDFQLLVSSVKDYAIFLLDKEGKVATWNSGAEHIKGYTADEIIGRPIDIFYTAEELKGGIPKRNLRMALEHGRFETEGWRVRKDGSTFWADVVFTPLYDEEEKFYGYAKVTKDITEKRSTDEQLRFLATIADNIEDPVITTDNNSIITKWNDAAEKLLEWQSEEVLGKDSRVILQGKYPGQSRESILEILKKDHFWHGEIIYHTKSGRAVNVLVTASHLKDASENVTGVLVLIRDITKRIDAEKKLKEFEYFFNNSNDFSCIANAEGYFEIINPSFTKVLGYSPDELSSKPFIDFVHPDDIAATMEAYDQLKSGATVIHFINRYRKHDGSYLLFDWNATPNPVTGKLYCIARDITDQRKAEEAIKRSNQELEAFSYSVSHDLRAPLRAVNGYAKILEEDYNSLFDDEGKRLLLQVQSNALKMGRLIDDLLSFSRLGRKDVERAMIDMNALVDQAIKDISQTDSLHAEIKLHKLLPVKADYALMLHVMINLISNAVKYSAKKEKPVVEIRSKMGKGEVIYSVKDNGAGFDMDYVQKLFGVFQRLHSDEEFPGTGVGLAIVKRTIQKHDGKIWAEGKVGEGATFYISLPYNHP